jgi:hypothetical protein
MTTEAPFEVDDAIVLLLGAPTKLRELDGRIEGITRLEKLIFLFERETELKDLLDDDLEFYAHNFGPFSKQVYQAVEVLEAAKLITDSAKLSNNNEDAWETEELIGDQPDAPYTTRNFELTERGRRYYNALREQFLSDERERDLTVFKEKFGSIPLRQLIRYVYKRYDDQTVNSLIRDQVLGE